MGHGTSLLAVMRILGRRSRRQAPQAASAGPLPTGASDAPTPAAVAEAAVAAGHLIEAVETLRSAVRLDPDPALEQRLVELRHLAFAEVAGGEGRPTWPPSYPDLTADVAEPPRVRPGDLSSDVLGSAIVNHGALHVEGFLRQEQVTSLVDGIDRAFAGRDRWGEDDTVDESPWFVPFVPSPEHMPAVLSRQWVREGGGVWAADSPRVFARMLEAFDDLGLGEVIGGYLGERPAISMRKCTLRRCPADLAHADWHQDGAFLGHDVRSVNVWLALTTCGGDSDAPGLEYVPRRVALQETGTKGAYFEWSVGPDQISEVVAETGSAVVRPRFEAGDALLFDDRFLHRTAVAPSLGTDRYAIESWFFAPSTYPADQIPLVF